LLLVIAIIAILAGVVFVALDPATRLKDTRDSVRQSDIGEIISAVKLNQVDNGGAYLAPIESLVAGSVYMIGTSVTGCDDQNANCDTAVSADTACVTLATLVSDGYLGEVPISPLGAGIWSAGITGYTMTKNASGTITVRSCESENTTEISLSR
jgi:type IV pilus assembly protein PilA